MIHVVGGVYREICREGQWDELCGSGLRAAATIIALRGRAKLSSYASSDSATAVQAAAIGYGAKVEIYAAPDTVTFEYEHALATPVIRPSLDQIERAEPIRIEASNVTRFGMLEGDAVVKCERAVYDPQSAHRPAFFSANGSRAEQLVVVCNRREAALLSGSDGRDLTVAGTTIAERDKASVVVVKCGTQGVYVWQSGELQHIAAYRTATVWPIGSGDVFSGAFAQAWILDDLDPIEAARRASLATAWYCGNRSLPAPKSLEGFAPSEAPAAAADHRVYLAGPFFTMMQRWMIEQARTALHGAGLRVFSPLHDVGHGTAEDVASEDLRGLEDSAAVFAVCDGLDSGTMFEIGYARKLGLPVVALVENETPESLKMLAGSGCHIAGDFVSAIYQLAWLVNE